MANTHSLDLESSSSQYAYITDANQTGLGITGDFTFEAWIKLESLSYDAYIISKNDSALNKRQYTFQVKSAGQIVITSSDNGGEAAGHAVSFNSANGVISTGSWYHIAATFDISEEIAVFYVNGEVVENTKVGSIGNTIYNSDTPFQIGANRSNNSPVFYYDGLLDDVRVWNDVRTPTEIADNYQKELVGNEAGLVGYWKFNNNAEDTTANNNDLTLSGSPSYSTDVPTWPIAYSLVCALGTFTLTGINATLEYARKLAMAVGSFTLTGIDVAFKMGKGLVAEVGNFVLTGKDATLKNARTMIASVGEFTLTGIDITFKKIITLVASVGRFILTGINVRLRSTAWNNDTKPSDTWTNDSK